MSAPVSDQPPKGDPGLDHRRKRLLREIGGSCQDDDFTVLLYQIGLGEEFESYHRAHSKIFGDLARKAPALVNSVITPAANPKSKVKTADYGCVGGDKEADVVSYFLQLLRRMGRAAAAKNKRRGGKTPVPTLNFTVKDYLSDLIPNATDEADVVLYYQGAVPGISAVHMVMKAKLESKVADIDDLTLGQITDYAHHMWKAQPTRTFVPVLLVRGPHVHILLFTRDKWYQTYVGNILYSTPKPRTGDVDIIRETMARLWFILTLRPQQFGHFCDVSNGCHSLVFTHGPNDKANATASACTTGENCVLLKELLPRPVRMLERVAYVYKATYGKRKAILKLAWTPVSRQPEGAVYDALAAKGVGDVPEVFDSGTLCKDMFEYRLEYIILQDCGETLDEHLAKLHADDEDDDVIEAKLTRVIQRVSACLVRAWNAGIIHRDISTGNIAVDGNKVAVIDWGYAKICEWTGLEDVAQCWDIDFEEICKVESENDKQTGTPIFMSIGLLFGRGKRDVYDDLESLFYVALYAIGRLDKKKIDNAHGFKLYSRKNLALVRASVLGNRNRYLERFDVIGIGNDLQKVLDAMHQCLFWTHSGYIGDNLWEDEYFRREPDWQLAAEFMDRETVQMLKQAQPTQDGAQPPPAPASVSSAQPSPAPTIASSVQQQPAPAPEYGYQMGASPAHALDARMDSVGDLCNAEPASRPQDTSGSYASSRYKRKSKDGGGMQSPKRSRMSGRGKENADSAR